MRLDFKSVLLSFGSIILFASIHTGQGWNVELVSTLYDDWDSAEAVDVRGNYAYVATSYSGLAVVDISDPENPFEVTYINTGITSDLAIVGDYIYATSYGLTIFDISDPENPFEVGNCYVPYAYHLDVQDDLACVTTSDSGMSIIDISDPENPFVVGSIVSRASASDVVIQGSYAYLVSYIFVEPEDGYLQIIDISDPTNPFETDYWFSNTQIKGVAVSGSYAYTAATGGGLRVIDISDPFNPFLAENLLPTNSYCTLVELYRNLAYVVNFGISVVDISDPLNLVELGFCDVQGATGIFVDEEYSYVSADGYGLRTLDISNPANPFEIGYYDPNGKSCDIVLIGDIAYIAAKWGGGLRIVDVSDPLNPFEISRLEIEESNSYGIGVSGDIVCLAEFFEGGLRIIDISDINNPVEVSFLELGSIAYQVELEGNYAYVANSNNGLRVVDISDCANPVIVGTCPMSSCNDVDIDNGYAFVAMGYDGDMAVIDISDPTNPMYVSSMAFQGYLAAVSVLGDYVYTAHRYGGLRIIDVSNPTSPVLLAQYYTINRSEDVTAFGDYAFLAQRYYGLQVFNVSNPTNPELVGSYDTPGWGEAVAVSGNLAYFCDLHYFEIFDYTDAVGIIPDVSVTLTPFNPPILIPANGGNFEFNFELGNTGTDPVVMDIWTMVTLPNGTEYGPIINFQDFNLQPGANPNRDRDQNIPANAPTGNYTYDAYVGEYPDSVYAEDHFDFEKLETDNGSSMVSDWNNWGEGFGDIVAIRESIPTKFALHPAFPNPFNSSTTISFDLPEAGKVSLIVYDIQGREVAKLVDGMKPAGSHQIVLDAKDLTSGVYFARLTAGEFRQVRKMLLVK